MTRNKRKNIISTREVVLFGILGSILYIQKLLLSGLPNIHLVAVLISAITIVYRKKALFPIYVYILLEGIFSGFLIWWVPYLYVWTFLFAAVLCIPKRLRQWKYSCVIYMLICGLNGLSFGTVVAPCYAFFYGMDFKQMMDWIAAGIPFDLIHGISNFCTGILVVPIADLIKRMEKISAN